MNVVAQGIIGIVILALLIVCVVYTLGRFIIEEWDRINSGYYDDDEDMYIRRK